MYADLHIHSTASDGIHAPDKIVDFALKKGLSVISLTDHDSTDGIDQAVEAARGTHLEVIPGIEINTDWEETEVHILGYYLDYNLRSFQDTLDEIRQTREERAKKMVDKLADIGVVLTYEQVKRIAGEATICRPHIAQAMIKGGYVSSIKDAFDRYLSRGKPGYVPRTKLDPFSAIAIIERAEGIPVLAHPGLSKRDDLIPALVKKGLLGIEVYYPYHTTDMVDNYRWFCQKYGLVMTGGTDYHGPGTEYPHLGEVGVEKKSVDNLKLMRSFLD